MRVFKVSFRTPGIFLDREGNEFRGSLEFELKPLDSADIPENWKKPSDLGIKVIAHENFQVDTITPTLRIGEITVPTRGDGTKDYEIIIPDTAGYEYRIVATKCPDCWDLFDEGTEEERNKIIDKGDRNGRIIVGKGYIPAVSD